MNHQTTLSQTLEAASIPKAFRLFQMGDYRRRSCESCNSRGADFKVARLHKGVKLEPRPKKEIELSCFFEGEVARFAKPGDSTCAPSGLITWQTRAK